MRQGFYIMLKYCVTCGGGFNVKPSHFKKRVNCSKKCYSIWVRKQLQGNGNPNYKGGISQSINNKCLFCEKIFNSTSYKPNKFCSRICQNRSQAIEKKEKAELKKKLSWNFRWVKIKKLKKKYYCKCGSEIYRKSKSCKQCKTKPKVEIKCKVCLKIFAVNYSQRTKKTCSNECFKLSHKKEFNPSWKGGITPENKKIRASEEYKKWRISVFERDSYCCVFCGQKGGILHADHIKQFAFYKDLRLDINNGRTLCKECHSKTDSYLKGKKKTN
jgi:hypothetical protein